MASPPSPVEPPGDAIIFRPSKKRKIYRRRAADEDDAPSPPTTAPVEQGIDELIADAAGQEMEGVQVSMAEILRLRKRGKRVGGVEFKAVETIRDDDGALVLHEGSEEGEEGDGEAVSKVVRRFAPQMGFGGGTGTGDVDRHM